MKIYYAYNFEKDYTLHSSAGVENIILIEKDGIEAAFKFLLDSKLI